MIPKVFINFLRISLFFNASCSLYEGRAFFVGLLCHSNKRYWLLAVADDFGHFVQLEALVALDGELFVVVLPGGEDEQLTAGNG